MRGELIDSHGRVLRDLRVSVTDRCNFRCLYCLPETEEAANFYQTRFQPAGNSAEPATPGKRILREWKPRDQLLTFEEIERVVRIFASMGIRKLRLTGGEPLLRRDLHRLVDRVSGIEGIEDLAMTTNGFLFARAARALRAAGLRRVSFSMDSLDRANFIRMTGRDGRDDVLAAIRLARELGFGPIKVNAVIIRGLNDHEIEDLAGFGLRENLSMRFIEFMPLDSARAWLRELVVPGREILERIRARHELVPVAPRDRAETARRWRFARGADTAEIGIIAPVSEPFCGHCNHIRLTADGQIRTCLFSLVEHDLKSLLRAGAGDDDVAGWLAAVVLGKEARHHIGEEGFQQPARTMSCIGG